MIYAVVKRYDNQPGGFEDWCFNPTDHYKIYDKLIELTGNDHEISADGACWAELAAEGDIYEFREGEIEMMDID